MKTLAHKTALSVVALTLVSILATQSLASQPKALLVSPGPGPGPGFALPKFGFQSFNIHGVGERVTHVHWNSRAAKLGLEPGDIVLSMNGFPLSYHGSWNDALYQAMANGGWVQLAIRDIRTGFIAQRQTYIGGPGYGPVTPKVHTASYYEVPAHGFYDNYYNSPTYGNGYPAGPITMKSVVGPQTNKNGKQNNLKTVKDIVKLFDKD